MAAANNRSEGCLPRCPPLEKLEFDSLVSLLMDNDILSDLDMEKMNHFDSNILQIEELLCVISQKGSSFIDKCISVLREDGRQQYIKLVEILVNKPTGVRLHEFIRPWTTPVEGDLVMFNEVM